MADTKLSALTELASIASGDLAYVVDVSDTTDGANGTSKKITRSNLVNGLAASGANSDITSLTGLTTPLTVAQGGTGAATLTSGEVLVGAGTSAVTSLGTSGTGNVVRVTSPTLVTPALGVASATSINKVAITEPASSATLTIANGKTLTASNTLTLAGTDSTTMTFPGSSDDVVGRTATQTLTNKTLTSPSLTTPTMTSPSVTSGDVNLATGLNIQVNSADPKRTMYVPASAMYPSTTAGCASLTQVESSTNDVNIKVLDFDGAGSSKEYAEFGIQSPTYWDASTVTAQFIWYATAGSGTVNWEIQGLALSDDDALDTAYGTIQEVTDTLLASGDVHITSETSAITIAGSPVAGDWLQFKIARDPANDTNTSDARLMGVRIRFGIKQYDDQ